MLIGLSGYARSGKDAAAQVLIARGYTRLSFADKLREFALALDPPISVDRDGDLVRLTEVIPILGWEQAKDDLLEVRRLLQRLGTEAGRQVLGENVWVDAVLGRQCLPDLVVITDVRFPNEAQAIKDRGGRVIRITRPGYEPVNAHPSEVALHGWVFDDHIVNDGDLGDLALSILKAVR